MARVIVSAGHTQKEPGAVVEDLREVDLTHKIASRITTKLRNKGIITLSVPPELDLSQRIDWINKTGYTEETDDICIEVHINDGGKSGLEGWYKDKGENKSHKLTEAILEESSKVTGLDNQGVKSEYDHSLQTLAFLHNTRPIGSLIECLYIDNPSDQKFLRDDSKLDLLAEGIVKGILKFFGIEDLQDKISPKSTTFQPTAPTFPRTSGYTSPPPIQSQPFTPYRAPTTYGAGGAFGTPMAQGMGHEDRKKMIEKNYHQILGRKVNNQDLNYFLNLGLPEEQMTKRLVESQEHADMVQDAQEYKKIKPEYDKLKVESQELRSQLKDKEDIILQQNELIGQKNRSIQELQKVAPNTGSTSRVGPLQQKAASPQVPDLGYQQISPVKESFLDRVLRKLNDIFD